MILLSRVEDRKAVLGLFNAAHELTHNHRYGISIFEYHTNKSSKIKL